MTTNNMDMPVEPKSALSKKKRILLLGAILLLLFVLWLIFRDTSPAMNAEKERLTIATVEKGEFNDYIRIIGQVMPNHIVYLDAIEGGRVEERLLEEGAEVQAGDVIVRLSNPLLNIGIMQSEADLAYQENELRNTRISMEQERLRLKQDRIGLEKELKTKERRYTQYKRLNDKELIAREEYLQAKEEYEAAAAQLKVVDERIEKEELFRDSQIKSLDENILNMKRSLVLIRERVENLKIKAPVDGVVGNLDAQIGQSVAQGERIGQVITADLKVQALIDEHYVEQVLTELPASFQREGKNYQLRVTKVYPEVQDGRFRTDLHFTTERPENIRAGQNYHIDLQLGEATQALLIPRGSFYQSSSGQYVFVVDADGRTARRKPVHIGRQNPNCYEVTDGLKAGDRVIISSYESYGDNQILHLK